MILLIYIDLFLPEMVIVWSLLLFVIREKTIGWNAVIGPTNLLFELASQTDEFMVLMRLVAV